MNRLKSFATAVFVVVGSAALLAQTQTSVAQALSKEEIRQKILMAAQENQFEQVFMLLDRNQNQEINYHRDRNHPGFKEAIYRQSKIIDKEEKWVGTTNSLYVPHRTLWTPLHWAIEHGDMEAVKELVKRGADINRLPDIWALPPISLAVLRGRKEILIELLTHQPDMQLRFRAHYGLHPKDHRPLWKTYTPLEVAKHVNRPDMQKLIYEAGTKFPYFDSVMFETSKYNHRGDIQWVVEHGGNVNFRFAHQDTSIMWFAYRGELDAVQYLIQQGAELNLQTVHGNTPIVWAITGKNFKILKELVDAGADVNIANHRGWTPLMWAITRGTPAMVEFLLKRGADTRPANRFGRTAYDLAAKAGLTQLLNKL